MASNAYTTSWVLRPARYATAALWTIAFLFVAAVSWLGQYHIPRDIELQSTASQAPLIGNQFRAAR
jgi:hypothetical protein